MATKKTAVIPEEEILAAATEENINEHALHQTETEPEPDRVLSAEGAPGDADLIDICQTDSESANPEAPHGMALQTEPHTVELVYAGQEVTVTELRADMYNERQRVEISLVKTMETDTLFGIGQRDELTHVTFGLYAAEKLVAADGSSIPQDGLIEMVSLNKDGKAMCKTDLPFGRFYLQEISTDSHYQLGDTKYPVSFDYAGQDKKLVKLIANEGAVIENKGAQGHDQVKTKYSIREDGLRNQAVFFYANYRRSL